MTKLVGEEDFLARWVSWSLWLLAVIVVVATVTGQVESFNGLYNWFSTHGTTGFWADFAPLMVDSFTIIGELAIFVGISRHWDWKSRTLPWLSAFIGIASSVAGNVGDKAGHPWTWEATAAIPPLAGAFGIVIGLGVLKRVARDRAERKAKQGVDISPDEVAESLAQSVTPKELALLQQPFEPSPNYTNDSTLRGLDVLIPPQEPPVREEASTWAGIVQPTTQPTPVVPTVVPSVVSREEARRRLSDLRSEPRLITQTGEFAAIR